MNIGIDIGGTNIGAGLLDKDLNFIYKTEIPTQANRGYRFVERQIICIIEKMIDIAEKEGEKVDSIGIGIPGIVDKRGKNIISSPNLQWTNIPMEINLRKKFNIDINIENDASLAGIAENILGVSKGYKDSTFITLGTGVGSGIIIDGKLYKGSYGIGAEIGHSIVGENFYNCNCGKNGCLETFSSSTALKKYVIKEIEKTNIKTNLLQTVEDIKDIDAKLIFQCALKGDELSNRAIDRMVKYLSIGIANIITIIDPQIIAIGGGVSKSGDFLIEKIKITLPNYISFKKLGYAEIKLAKLGNDAGIIGAAMLKQYK